ncbi:MAG: hypothetical protein AAGA26_08465 [Pseudomonadota bacterium]
MNRDVLTATRSAFDLPVLPIARMFAVIGERRRLRNLTDAELNDIGITYAESVREANRPFWDLPNH